MGLFGGDSSTTQNYSATNQGVSNTQGPGIAGSGNSISTNKVINVQSTDPATIKAAGALVSQSVGDALNTVNNTTGAALNAVSSNNAAALDATGNIVTQALQLVGNQAQQNTAFVGQQAASFTQGLQQFATTQSTNNDQRLLTMAKYATVGFIALAAMQAYAARKR